MSIDAGFILDGAILVLLTITIFYAARLSLFLKIFRDGRAEMAQTINELSRNIGLAQKAIEDLRGMAGQSGDDLQKVVNDAQFLSDELRIMTEAGDGLAGRLEKLAERNRELVELLEKSGGISNTAQDIVRVTEKVKKSRYDDSGFPDNDLPLSFMIQDRDHDDHVPDVFDEDDVYDADIEHDIYFGDEAGEDTGYADDGFSSEAERELYEALAKSKKRSMGGVS